MPIKIKAILSLLNKYNYKLVSQKGSHQKYRNPNDNTIIVPYHKELKKGTAYSILKDFSTQNKIELQKLLSLHNLKI